MLQQHITPYKTSSESSAPLTPYTFPYNFFELFPNRKLPSEVMSISKLMKLTFVIYISIYDYIYDLDLVLNLFPS